MVSTLYARLALGLFLLLLAVGLFYAFISGMSLREYNASLDQELNRPLARNLVSERNLVREGRLDEQALKDLFSLYMTINPSIEIYLLDTEGRILSFSASPDKVKRKHVSLAPIRQLLDDAAAYPVLGDDPRSHDRRKVFSVTPIPSAQRPEGYLYVVLRGEEYDSAEMMARDGWFIEMSAWAVGISLLFGMIAGLIVFRVLTHRLTRLADRVEHFENGEGTARTVSDVPWASRSGDEIDYLAAVFDRMAERIGHQMKQLKEQDGLRRRLIAQVSHDLRTPLAAMQGYVESLRMKRESLTADEQDRFLDIALDEGRRLSRLIEELFELAALDAREKRPHPEPFAPADLIHDVVLKHQPTADHKQIQLTVDGKLDLPLAWGDLGMTERVLDNLITNALRYSSPGSRVTLCLARSDACLQVSITDSGPGIEDQDLPHLFEAFYRADGQNTVGHAGLGLAIARRIMTLQKGTLVAANAPNGGAVFTLQLPFYRG